MKRFTVFFILLSIHFSIYSQESSGSSYLFIPHGSNFLLLSRGGSYRIIGHATRAEREFNSSVRQLASGDRVSEIGADPAGKAVAEKMETMIQEIRQRSVNDRDRISYLRYVDGIIGDVVKQIQRIRVLTVKASNGIMGETEREIIQTEIDMIVESVAHSFAYAQFNRKSIKLPFSAESLGLYAIDVVSSPGSSIAVCDSVIDRLSELRSKKGAESKMLHLRIEGQSLHFLYLNSAVSVIGDTDFAETSTSLRLSRVKIENAHGVLYRMQKSP